MIKMIHDSNGNITIDVGEYNQEEVVFMIRRALTNYGIESEEIYQEIEED